MLRIRSIAPIFGATKGPGEEDMNVDWSERLLLGRDRADKEVRQGLGRPEKTESVKRHDEVELGKKGRKKRMKYDIVDEDWGLVGQGGGENISSLFLYSGLEGVQRQGNAMTRPKTTKKRTDKALERAAAITRNTITEWTTKNSADNENIDDGLNESE